MGVLTDRNFNELLNKKDVVIYPLSTIGKNRITGLGYDLAIGKIVPLSEIDKFVDDGDIIRIPPKCYCLLITEEFVWISEKHVGTLHIRGTLAAKGLYTNCTNVDPGFGGQMIMSVYNVSDVDIVINKSQSTTFITLIVHEAKSIAEAKVGIGEGGTKKATRVLDEMLEDIYTDKIIYSKQIENIYKLIVYSRKMNDDVSPNFNDLVLKATKANRTLINLDILNSFIVKLKDFVTTIPFKIIQVIAICLSTFFLVQIIQCTLKGGCDDKMISLRFAIIALAALVTLLKEFFKK
jgi:deoxycytidine triphosphate deaminase